MAAKKMWVMMGAVYDRPHWALWASLAAFCFYFALIVAPNIPAARARYQSLQTQQIAAEHEFYCNKWGMGPRTQAHDECISELLAFRAKVEQRMSDEIQGLF